MTAFSTSADHLRAILVLLATVATIGVNYLGAAGVINGVTPAQISDRYPTVLALANYSFSIWGLVYAGLLVFSIYQLLPANIEKYRRIRTIYIASCLLNSLWIYFWLHDRITLCFAIIVLLGVCLFLINRFLRTSKSPGEY